MTTIMSSSDSSFKRVVDKAQDDDDCHWLDAKLSVQEEDLNGPDVKGYEEPIEQAAGWDLKAQALSSKSQDKMTAGIKSPSSQGRGATGVKVQDQDSLQPQDSSPITTETSFASTEALSARIQSVLVDGHAKLKAKAATHSDSIMGSLRQSSLTATHPNAKTTVPRSQAVENPFSYKLPESKAYSRLKNIPVRQVKVPVEVDDWNLFYQATFGKKKPETLFGKLKKNLPWIAVGIIMIVVGLAIVMPNGGSRRRSGAVPFVDRPVVPTGDHQDVMAAAGPTADFDGEKDKQGEGGAVSEAVNATHAADAPSNVPTSALSVYSPPFPSALSRKIEDWIPTWSSSKAWKHESDSMDSKAVDIIQVSSTEAPTAIWKLSFEYFELEETGDVNVGIVCDTDFTGAYDTSKILYGGPAPLFFKSQTVSPNEVSIEHGFDWYLGLPLITVGFGRTRPNWITVVCGDMPSESPSLSTIALSGSETDANSGDSTNLSDSSFGQGGCPSAQVAVLVDWAQHHLSVGGVTEGKALVGWQVSVTTHGSLSEPGPAAIAASKSGSSLALFVFPRVEAAVPVFWVQHFLAVGGSSNDKALAVWQPGIAAKQARVSESKAHRDSQDNADAVDFSTSALAFVVTFDVYKLQPMTTLDIRLECVFKDTGPPDLARSRSRKQHQVLFLSHTFLKHQVNVSIKRSDDQTLVTVRFGDDESSITAICEDFEAIVFSDSSLVPSSAASSQLDPRTVGEGQTPPMRQPDLPSTDSSKTVSFGLGLLLFLTLCGSALAVKQSFMRRIEQVPRPPAAPSNANSNKKAQPLGILKPRIRKANQRPIRFDREVTEQVPRPPAAPSNANSNKKARPPGILKPRIRKANQRPIRFDREVTVREYHRTVGVRPLEFSSSRTDYALSLDWTFEESKAQMASFGHVRSNHNDYHVDAPMRRQLLVDAGIDDDELERLEARARALREAGAGRRAA